MAGVAALALTGWSWAGRSPGARWWFHRQGYHSLVLGALPGMGLLLVVGAVVGLAGGRAVGLLVPLFLVGVVIVFVGIARPPWWGPRWFRESPEARQRKRH